MSKPVIVQRNLTKEPISQAERDTISEQLSKWRIRLYQSAYP
jgi:hypothetical protein